MLRVQCCSMLRVQGSNANPCSSTVSPLGFGVTRLHRVQNCLKLFKCCAFKVVQGCSKLFKCFAFKVVQSFLMLSVQGSNTKPFSSTVSPLGFRVTGLLRVQNCSNNARSMFQRFVKGKSASSSGFTIPFSVMNPEINFAGVTSKAGFKALDPGEAIRIVRITPSVSGPE